MQRTALRAAAAGVSRESTLIDGLRTAGGLCVTHSKREAETMGTDP